MTRNHFHIAVALLFVCSVASSSRSTSAQDRPPPPPTATGPQPFGANMFTGSYAAQRENGLNPTYVILSGDRVMVNAWGAVTINDVFAVDTQGNIFVPTVGPIHLAGVANSQLTDTVRAQIRRVYRGTFGVYTNLLTASPVAVFVTGGVPRPGRYAGIPSDSALFFIDQAGGINPTTGSYRRVRVIRQGNAIAEIDLYEFLTSGALATTQFEDGDTILVERRGPTVEVRRPGQEAMLIELSGEFTTAAEVLAVVSGGARSNGVTLTGMRGGESMARTIGVSQVASTPLADGDVLTFREDLTPHHVLIRLEGEFRGPAAIAVHRGARLLDVLNHVEIDPAIASTGAVYIRRESVRREQRRALLESLDRIERATMLAITDDTDSESQIRVREAEMVRQWTERARNIQPLGRMVTSTANVELNVLLEDGDVIVIPRRTNVVRVVGEVNVPHAVQFRPDLSVDDYVRMAGGYSRRADTGQVLVMRANAEIIRNGDVIIQPGDEIMIPPSVEDKWLQNGIDIAAALYQIAVSAGVVVRAAVGP